MTAPGARRLVQAQDGRVVEQVMHPCGQWIPTVDTADPLAAAKGIRTAFAAVALFLFTLAVLWATVHSPLLMGCLVLVVVLYVSVIATWTRK